jgi:hypothetical protein
MLCSRNHGSRIYYSGSDFAREFGWPFCESAKQPASKLPACDTEFDSTGISWLIPLNLQIAH